MMCAVLRREMQRKAERTQSATYIVSRRSFGHKGRQLVKPLNVVLESFDFLVQTIVTLQQILQENTHDYFTQAVSSMSTDKMSWG